ncbi:class I SAM-dependent methyltransferase [uncultured Draconibacterium sp.]|uniref:class I SAM-dependent methyltransferase n=1 Tax=uncultured Draconibacterium sp. TaxID=1573823 RepID=UPI003217D15A
MNKFDISIQKFDQFASEYATRFKNIDAYSKHFEKFCELTNQQNPAVLELACGPGNVTRYLKQTFHSPQIIAIDLAPAMIKIARENVEDVDFRIMDVRNILTLDQQFDCIMCSFCLPFLSKNDSFKLIADCSKKLKSNGVLYISTMEGDESKAGFESTRFSGNSKVYFNYHKKTDLQNALLQNGFKTEYTIEQDYAEQDGRLTTDLIFIAKKV